MVLTSLKEPLIIKIIIKVSLIIKIIYFNGIFLNAHLVMLVIFHVIICQNFNLPHIYCIFGGKFSLFDMNFFELITQYPNVIQTM
jgi:hypothetical protein